LFKLNAEIVKTVPTSLPYVLTIEQRVIFTII